MGRGGGGEERRGEERRGEERRERRGKRGEERGEGTGTEMYTEERMSKSKPLGFFLHPSMSTYYISHLFNRF